MRANTPSATGPHATVKRASGYVRSRWSSRPVDSTASPSRVAVMNRMRTPRPVTVRQARGNGPACRGLRRAPFSPHDQTRPLAAPRRAVRVGGRPGSLPAGPGVQRRGGRRAGPGRVGGAADSARQVAGRLLHPGRRRAAAAGCRGGPGGGPCAPAEPVPAAGQGGGSAGPAARPRRVGRAAPARWRGSARSPAARGRLARACRPAAGHQHAWRL